MTPEDQLFQSFISLGPVPPPHSSFELECRICLQPARQADEATISPCKCSGSIAHVHFKCLSEWISKHHKVPLSETPAVDYFPCEMCKSNITFETEKRLQCLTANQCASNCRNKKLMLVILLVMSLSFLTLFVYGIILVISRHAISLAGSAWFESLLIISSLLIVLTVQLLATYILLAKFVVTWTATIVKIGAEVKGRPRSHSTCISEANLITGDRKIRNSQMVPLDIVLEDIPG